MHDAMLTAGLPMAGADCGHACVKAGPSANQPRGAKTEAMVRRPSTGARPPRPGVPWPAGHVLQTHRMAGALPIAIVVAEGLESEVRPTGGIRFSPS